MAILPIVHYPDPILEVKCKRVEDFDDQLEKLLDDMYETMVEADGVGLAAPQIGIDRQIAIVDIEDEHGVIELINPTIISKQESQTDIEGCLSFPDIYGKVTRAYSVVVAAFDRHGMPFKLKADGFLARALQHEIDHLNGVLFTSKVIEYVNLDAEESEDN